MIDVFYNHSLFLFFQGIGSILNSAWLIKLMTFVLLISMQTSSASREFLKFVPIIDNFITASPTFLEVMEDRLSWVKVARALHVFLILVIFEAPVPFASLFALIAHYINIIQNIPNPQVYIILNIVVLILIENYKILF